MERGNAENVNKNCAPYQANTTFNKRVTLHIHNLYNKRNEAQAAVCRHVYEKENDCLP